MDEPVSNNPFLNPTPSLPEDQPTLVDPMSTEMKPKPSVEITEAHKEAFFRAFLTDTPYEEEFSLLAGRFRVRFRAITMEQNADLLQQISIDRDKGAIDSANDYYFRRVADYRLGLSIVSLNDQDFLPEVTKEKHPLDKKTGESYITKKADVLGTWTMAKMAAVQAAMAEFDQRNIALVDAVAKPDFWKAAAQFC